MLSVKTRKRLFKGVLFFCNIKYYIIHILLFDKSIIIIYNYINKELILNFNFLKKYYVY